MSIDIKTQDLSKTSVIVNAAKAALSAKAVQAITDRKNALVKGK